MVGLEAGLARSDDGLGTIGYLELAKDVRDVITHRLQAETRRSAISPFLMTLKKRGIDLPIDLFNPS